MKNSYTIFPGNKNAWRTSKVHLSLDWLNPKYSLPFASENRLYDKDGIKVYIQEFALSPFKIDLIQVEVSTTTYIPIETHCRCYSCISSLKAESCIPEKIKPRLTTPPVVTTSCPITGPVIILQK